MGFGNTTGATSWEGVPRVDIGWPLFLRRFPWGPSLSPRGSFRKTPLVLWGPHGVPWPGGKLLGNLNPPRANSGGFSLTIWFPFRFPWDSLGGPLGSQLSHFSPGSLFLRRGEGPAPLKLFTHRGVLNTLCPPWEPHNFPFKPFSHSSRGGRGSTGGIQTCGLARFLPLLRENYPAEGLFPFGPARPGF